ncbi:MAG: hypothetical protein AB1696_20710 [Planctomycetota bacterium]
MFPRDFFDTYWRTEIRDEIFVAMPFHDEFTPVWTEAIQPAIDHDLGGTLHAKRVDATVLCGSVITDILDGIAHARIVLADVSVARDGHWAGQRNGNVMYEVGIAHAVRQTTEILLIRSDDEPINFDVAHIKVHKYYRADLRQTREQICALVKELLRQIEQEKSLKVTRAIDLLDARAMRYLSEFAVKGPFCGPDPKNMGEELVSISNYAALVRLQQLGILRWIRMPSPSGFAFHLTPFGNAVAKRLGL